MFQRTTTEKNRKTAETFFFFPPKRKLDKLYHQTLFCIGKKTHKTDLDDYFQSFYFLIRGPCILQRLVQFFNSVHIILLSQIQQLFL